MAGTINGLTRPTGQTSLSSRASSNRISMKYAPKDRLSSIGGENQEHVGNGHAFPTETAERPVLSPPILESSAQETEAKDDSEISFTRQEPTLAKPTLRAKSPPTAKPKLLATNSAVHREVEDLKTKLRMMEKKRIEDRDRLKSLDRIQAERDKFEGIIQRLQSKYKPQQQEVDDLRKQVHEGKLKLEELEKQLVENDTAVEVATLDREMAEETAEGLKIDLESLRQGHEELMLEVEFLREENQELGKEMSPEERTSQGWLQMEKSNERLREALMRLRDITQEQEADLKRQIADLEHDLRSLKDIKGESTQLKANVMNSEVTIENLKLQLDAALGAEEMVEELTEKNLSLNEQVENLKAAVEELESLKELNDELELNHAENAKQMQDEIDYNEALMAEQARNSLTQDRTIQDLEFTVTKFRSLVSNMQSDLEDMRVSQQLTEAEASDLTSRSQAMMDLNMRLQLSASKAQVKAIDVELRDLEAQESAEHLAIIQMFLPKSFETEQDSVRAMLRFKRIGFKANLLYGYIKEKASEPSSPGHEDDVFACCDLMEKLTWVSSTCNRFGSFIRACSLETFANLAGALFDLEPVERAFNGWVEALKSNELKEEHCNIELQRSIAVMAHLVEIHISEGLHDFAEDTYTRALLTQSKMDSASTALTGLKNMVEARCPSTGDGDDGETECRMMSNKFDDWISQTRSAKIIASKIIRQLEDLKSRSLTLDPSTLPVIEQSQASTFELAQSSRTLGFAFHNALNDESFSSNNPTALLPASEISALSSKLQLAVSDLQSFHSLTANFTKTTEIPGSSNPPPWNLLAERLRDEASQHVAQEAELLRLKEEAKEKQTTILMRDKTVEEMGVKVEVLEKRVGEVGGRREELRQLEDVVEKAKHREAELVRTVNRLRVERNSLREEKDTLEKDGVKVPTTAEQARRDTMHHADSSAERVEELEADIKTLQAAIRHLRAHSYSHTISSASTFLDEPLQPMPSPKEQKAKLRQSEARAVLKEMLTIAVSPDNGHVRFKRRTKEERLGWRPVKESCRWRVGRAQEEWESWRGWARDVAEDISGPKSSKKSGRLKGGGNVLGSLSGVSAAKSAVGDVMVLEDDHLESIVREVAL